MKTAHILLLCILGAALISTSLCHSIGPDNCCFEFYDKIIRRSLISSYVRTDYRCAKAGVIFTTVKGREVCVDPSRPWVKKIISRLDTGSF
ncbi:C-C motif chemokine 3-like [Kryptolebias marmoratus]|uniref:C-C motif chemokine n=1 Tax=Kryptolebias marmoratus TaxID=37003 RepID=A0A3Q2ZM23_KRYMA|nr:C-C motif chemokine 3-like [Kryptolebias marmoratus]